MDSEDTASRTKLAKGVAAHLTTPLPVDFVLGDNDVICGRGSRCFNHVGNKRFRKLVESYLDQYTAANTKLAKTDVICEIVNVVRTGSPDGGFVKKDKSTGLFYEVGDFLAREKTSQAFRDALHEQYKSSNAAKKKKRWNDNFKRGFSSAPTLGTSGINSVTAASHSLSSQKNFTFSLKPSSNEDVDSRANLKTDMLDGMLKRGLQSNRSIKSVLEFAPMNLASDIQEVRHEQFKLEHPGQFVRQSRPKYESAFSCPNLNAARKSQLNARNNSSSGFANFSFNSVSPTGSNQPSAAMACGKRNLLLERMMGNSKLQSREQQPPMQVSEPSTQSAVAAIDPIDEKNHAENPFEELPFETIQEMSENPLDEKHEDNSMFDQLMHYSDHFHVNPADLICMLEPDPIEEFH